MDTNKVQVQVIYTHQVAEAAGLKYATDGSLAVDLVATDNIVIHPMETVKNNCGFKMKLPQGFGAMIIPRSGLGAVLGVTLANSTGLIDTDYHEEVTVVLTVKDHIYQHETLKGFLQAEGGKLTDNLLIETFGNDDTMQDIVGVKFSKGDRIAQMIVLPIPQAEFVKVKHFDEYGSRKGGFGSTGVAGKQ